MSVQAVPAGSLSALQSSTSRFSLPGAADFSHSLNLGQIIKGKVLRQYEGNRYLVNFDGHDRVVDSAVPLSTGELIHGRVIGLGDHVELQRMYPQHGREDSDAPTPQASDGASTTPRAVDRREQWLDDLLTRYQTELNGADRTTLNQVVGTVEDPMALAMVSVALNKLGLSQTPDLVLGVYSLLKRMSAVTSSDSFSTDTLAAAATAQLMGASLTSTRDLAEALTKAIGQKESEQDRTETNTSTLGDAALPTAALVIDPRMVKQIRDDASKQNMEQVAWRVLNAQTNSTVAHRAGMLPLLLGNRLVEVSVALFEQQRDADQSPEAKHRQVIFSLRTEHLGAVEIRARLSGARARIQVTLEDETKTEHIAAHTHELRSLLAQSGWEVDEISYESRETADRNPAVASVVEHIALQDSLDRFV